MDQPRTQIDFEGTDAGASRWPPGSRFVLRDLNDCRQRSAVPWSRPVVSSAARRQSALLVSTRTMARSLKMMGELAVPQQTLREWRADAYHRDPKAATMGEATY